MYAHLQRTESTGHIHIRSSDASAPPSINFRFLATDADRRAAVLAVRRASDIAAAEPIRDAIAEELAPGRHIETDEQILDFIRQTGQITPHMVGTCKHDCHGCTRCALVAAFAMPPAAARPGRSRPAFEI